MYRSLIGTAATIVALTAGAAPALPWNGRTERVSVDSLEREASVFVAPEGQALGSFAPSISASGRSVAFSSNAADLVPGDTNGLIDVFLRDRLWGTTERVSVSGAGGQANGLSGEAAVSGDGRFVAFGSEATNLVPGDTNGREDVFVRDRLFRRTERVSLDAGDRQLAGASIEAAISHDGRFVAFRTVTPPGDPDPVYVRDRFTGTTELVSLPPTGPPTGDSFSPAISGDGRFVAFNTLYEGSTHARLLLHDRAAGTTEVVGEGLGGASLSATGRILATTAGVGVASVVVVLDRASGRTERLGAGFAPEVSPDGRFVAFNDLAPRGPQRVLLHDRWTGRVEVASVSSTGVPAADSSFASDISAQGRHVAFQSPAANLVPRDTNGVEDVFVRDRAPGWVPH